MNAEQSVSAAPLHAARTPRLWPACFILLIQATTIGLSITPGINNAVRFGYMMLGPTICVLLFLIWLLAFSRLPWKERLGVAATAIVVAALTALVIDASMGVSMWIYGAPLAMAVITAGIWFGRQRSSMARFSLVAALLLLVWGLFPFARLDGFRGDYLPELTWRWAPTAEDALGGESAGQSTHMAPTAEFASWTPTTVEWPMFRGPRGDSRVVESGADLEWTGEPKILWRLPVGPAWSSFSHVSGRLFTQEQREEEESVTCIDAATGTVIWRTGFPCRFSDVVAGAGPRATPTYLDGRLYTFGAKAILACLEASTGKVLWQRDLMAEVNAQLPVWGFSSSPLAIASLIIVYAGGDGDNGLIAYDQLSGEPVWRFASHGMNFSSAQRIEVSGRELVLFGDESGFYALEPATGAVAWKLKPAGWSGPAICQPQQVGPNSLIIPLGDGKGVTRLTASLDGSTWNVKEEWSSKKLKPSFNDFVYHEGYCYGFDNHLFSCIDANTGELKWKHKGYEFGQVLLLADVGKLVVTTEKGDVVLLATDPTAHRELGRYPAIQGKTWNHPIAAAGRLFVRNGEEAVALALSSKVVGGA
jgi:outer membrane protein assembly factor BamB